MELNEAAWLRERVSLGVLEGLLDGVSEGVFVSEQLCDSTCVGDPLGLRGWDGVAVRVRPPETV